MSIDLAELRKLSVAERIQLAEDLWDSIAVDAAQVPGADGGAAPART